MVGKIKHVRQKRHQDAVKILQLKPAAWEPSGGPLSQGPPSSGAWGPPSSAGGQGGPPPSSGAQGGPPQGGPPPSSGACWRDPNINNTTRPPSSSSSSAGVCWRDPNKNTRPPPLAAGGRPPPSVGGQQGPPPPSSGLCWRDPNNTRPPPETQNSRHDDAIKENKKTLSSFPSGIFSGTKISREALVQTLKIEEPTDVVLPSPADKGVEEKKLKSKKEKMKERRDRWLNKISSIKQAREEQVAEARRKAMPVVGDMKPLAEALPELSQLLTPSSTTSSFSSSTTPSTASTSQRRNNRKNKVPVKKKPEPTDFSLMKQPQKRKFLETESSRFGEAAKSLASKANPLADIAEQLRKRMKQEEEGGGGPS